MNDIFNFFSPLSFVKSGIVAYNPLINYDWSTTTTSGLRYLKDVGSTPAYNASMYFGRGAYLNGVDQTITVPINTTIQTALKRVNGVVTISETSQILTNYVISGLGVHKDYYLFTRLLTTAEKDSYTNTSEAFYAMAQSDNTCVLNMPMCEKSSKVRNYKTGIDYAITNYTTSVRDNAKKLQYGLQTCKFVRNSLGVIQSASDYLECDGVGYADTGWIPDTSSDEEYSVELIMGIKTNTDTFVYAFKGIGIHNLWHIKQFNYSNGSFNVGIGTDYFNSFGTVASKQDGYVLITVVVYATHFEVYLDGVYLDSKTRNNKIANSLPFLLGVPNTKQGIEEMITPIRLFKVHNKALTQEEVTKAYTDAVNKGLLS